MVDITYHLAPYLDPFGVYLLPQLHIGTIISVNLFEFTSVEVTDKKIMENRGKFSFPLMSHVLVQS